MTRPRRRTGRRWSRPGRRGWRSPPPCPASARSSPGRCGAASSSSARWCRSRGCWSWRIALLGHLQTTPAAMVRKAFELQPLFVLVVTASLCRLLAVECAGTPAARANGSRRGSPALFALRAVHVLRAGLADQRDRPGTAGHRFPPGDAAPGPGDLALAGRGRAGADPLRCRCLDQGAEGHAGPGPPRIRCSRATRTSSPPRARGTFPAWMRTTRRSRARRSPSRAQGSNPGSPVELWWVDPLRQCVPAPQGRGVSLRAAGCQRAAFAVDVTMPYSIGPTEKGTRPAAPHRGAPVRRAWRRCA